MRPVRAGRAVLAAAAVTLLAVSPAAAHVRTDHNLIPRHGALLGAFVNRDGDMWSGVESFQRMLGFKLTIVHHYKPWRITSFSVDQAAMRSRQIPMISWSPGGTTTAAEIASGSQDAVITRTAHAVKALRRRCSCGWPTRWTSHPAVPATSARRRSSSTRGGTCTGSSIGSGH